MLKKECLGCNRPWDKFPGTLDEDDEDDDDTGFRDAGAVVVAPTPPVEAEEVTEYELAKVTHACTSYTRTEQSAPPVARAVPSALNDNECTLP